MAIYAYTDGACRGNPGPGGWGVLICEDGKHQRFKGGEVSSTNNRMELTAAIRALELISPGKEIVLTTDSTYVKNGIESWIMNWKRNGWKTANKKPVKNADLWVQLDTIVATHNVKFAWVKGHSGHTENEIADILANEAIDELLAKES